MIISRAFSYKGLGFIYYIYMNMFIVYLVLGSLCAVITLWFSTKVVLGLLIPDVTFWTLLKVSVYDIASLSWTIFFYMAMAGKNPLLPIN